MIGFSDFVSLCYESILILLRSYENSEKNKYIFFWFVLFCFVFCFFVFVFVLFLCLSTKCA